MPNIKYYSKQKPNNTCKTTSVKTECTFERFSDPDNTGSGGGGGGGGGLGGEAGLMEEQLNEAIQLYGIKVSYFTHGYTLTSHDYLYGEDVTSYFGNTKQMIVLAEMNQDSLILSKFGILNDADLTVTVLIRTFTQTMSTSAVPYPEPKSGDLIRLDELGLNRPNGRTPPIFEVTERRDLVPQLNVNRLLGVYAWHIKAKRFDYSYETNAPVEGVKKQVSDDTFYGRLSGGMNPESPPKDYTQNAPDASKDIFDYTKNGNLDKVYGDYS